MTTRYSTYLLAGVLCVALAVNPGTKSPVPASDDSGAAKTAVRIIPAPDKALVPDVVVDAKGVLHMVYGLGDHAWYTRSTDNGGAFSPPVQINSAGKVQLTMGERGPKLAVGSDGSIHVVWVDRWSPGAKCYVRYARSTDGGRRFESAKQVSPMPGVDGATMTADGEGNALVFWHVFEPPQEEVPNGHWIYLSRSTDNGVSFAAAERVEIGNIKDLACSMCMMRARIGDDGNAYLAFRSAENNIRDFYVLRGRKTENRFTALRVNQDNWELKTCPMCGPELTFDHQGRAFCAFMSRHRVYWSELAPGDSTFQLHVATPAHEQDEIYPAAVANGNGEVLFLWQVGPMSVTGRATVKWAIYRQDGTFTGQQGTIGVSSSGTKATAFAGRDDNFYIVTTANRSTLPSTASVLMGIGTAGDADPHATKSAAHGHATTPRAFPAVTAPASALADVWSQPRPLSRGGAVGSPGGTHPLVVDGKNIHAVYWQGGNIHYRRSADSGATWSDAVQLTTGGTALYPCSLERTGSALHLIWPDSRNAGKWEVYYKRSTDGGKTWGHDTRLTSGVDLFRMGTAVSGPAIHVVWANKSLLERVPAGDATWTWTWGEIYYQRSTDGGVTWEKGVRLTQPESSAMRPAVAVSGQYVHVCWFDRRDSEKRPAWDWTIYYKRSTDGGVTWGPDVCMSHSSAHARHPQVLALPEGQVCLIWEDGQIWEGGQKWSGDGALYAAASKDNGETWGKPQRITFVNSPNGRATHAKSYAAGRRIHLTWTDAVPGSSTDPVRAQASYYTTSPDGGLTWQSAERLAEGQHGAWEAAAVAGTETSAVELLAQSEVLYVSTRPATAAGSAQGQDHHATDAPRTTPAALHHSTRP